MPRRGTAGTLAIPGEDDERGMYELTRGMLAAHGFHQYEISNFAREGFACRHTIGCWTRAAYLGFGCAAHSYFEEWRTQIRRRLMRTWRVTHRLRKVLPRRLPGLKA